MNAERLHAIAAALRKEMVDTQTGSQISGLCNSLQQMLQQNNHPQFQQNLATNLQKIYSSLSTCPSDDFSPAWKQLLSEMGGSPFFGLTLKSTIEEIFQRNQTVLTKDTTSKLESSRWRKPPKTAKKKR